MDSAGTSAKYTSQENVDVLGRRFGLGNQRISYAVPFTSTFLIYDLPIRVRLMGATNAFCRTGLPQAVGQRLQSNFSPCNVKSEDLPLFRLNDVAALDLVLFLVQFQ